MTETPPLLSGADLAQRAALAIGLPLPQALGVRLVDDGTPAAGVRFTVGEIHDNGAGGMHASALSVTLELAGYLALAPHLTSAEHAVTHSAATSYLGSATAGDEVLAQGSLDRRTRRLAFLDVTAVVGGDLVARCQLVKSIAPWSG